MPGRLDTDEKNGYTEREECPAHRERRPSDSGKGTDGNDIMTLRELIGFLPASLTVGGEKIVFPTDGAADTVSVRLTEESPDPACLYRTFAVKNEGSVNTAQITHPWTVDAAIPCGESVLLHTLKGDNCSGESFMPVDRALRAGDTVVMEPEGGRSSNTTAFPFFDFDFGGFAVLFAVGWSGQWRCEIEKTADTLYVRFGMARADFYLKPGEEVKLPSSFTVLGEDGASVRRLARRIMRTHYDPLAGRVEHLPVSMQPFDRYFYGQCPIWPTEEGQKRTIACAEKCRYIDTDWLDAAWFLHGFPTGVGNYEFDPGFPNGLTPISDAAHEAGMRFMAWFEPERVHRDSNVGQEHREFLLPVPGTGQWFLFDLGNEAAYRWLYEKISGMIRDCGIDNYRQDFNIDPLDIWAMNDEENRVGILEIGHINGLYRFWDDLRAEFPNLVIDDCSSGGRRIDFETMRRAVPLWRTDNPCRPISLPEKPADTFDQNETLALGEYLPYHASGVWEPQAYDVRSSATEGLACTFDVLNPAFDFERAAALLGEVNRTAAYWSGDFYPLTAPTLEETGFAAYELVRDGDGFAKVFRRRECEADTFRLSLCALDPAATYRLIVTDENGGAAEEVLPGALLVSGIDVHLPEKRTSALIEFTKI